jgi:hypothetical protein
MYFLGSNKKQRCCDGREGGGRAPFGGANVLKKTGARSARARTRGQNRLVIIIRNPMLIDGGFLAVTAEGGMCQEPVQ